ncbi:hypothetical protein V1527DRAFT_515780 [Lipomyces starkeyi]
MVVLPFRLILCCAIFTVPNLLDLLVKKYGSDDEAAPEDCIIKRFRSDEEHSTVEPITPDDSANQLSQRQDPLGGASQHRESTEDGPCDTSSLCKSWEKNTESSSIGTVYRLASSWKDVLAEEG